jgi:thioesterase domain-containing protein
MNDIQWLPATTSLSFDACLKQLLAPLISGDAVVLLDSIPEEPSKLLSVFSSGTSALNCVPSLWRHILDVLEKYPNNCYQNLARVFLGGEHIAPDLIQRSLRLLPHTQIFNLYGPTEATANAAYASFVSAEDISIGKPIDNTRAYVCDALMQPVPPGVAGELYIGGTGLARGYLNRPDLTAEKFVPDPFDNRPGLRLYRTGDQVKWRHDGNLEFMGRYDMQVKVRGFRVEPGEIEAALLKHDSVAQAAVIAREDQAGHKQLVAYVVMAAEQTIDPEALRRYVAERLPEYMVPATIVEMNQLPLMPSGKLDRKALPAPWLHGRSEVNGRDSLPQTELQNVIRNIWHSVLGIENISIFDNFFDIGGHSLLILRVHTELQGKFGGTVRVTDLFRYPTIASLAEYLETVTEIPSDATLPLAHLRSTGSKPPLYLAHPIGGDVQQYRELVPLLREDRPVIALQNLDQGNGGREYATLDEMAAHYVKAISTAQPDGPYFIGGWSMGGVLAFEMAAQLKTQGKEVPFLVMIDPPICDSAHQMDDNMEATNSLIAMTHLVMLTDGKEFSVTQADLEGLEWQEQLKFMLRYLQEAGALRTNITESAFARAVTTYMTHLRALRRYRPKLQDGPALFLKAAEPDSQTDSSLEYKAERWWRQFIRGAFVVQRIPGNHVTIMRGNSLNIVAEIMQKHLDDADALDRTDKSRAMLV